MSVIILQGYVKTSDNRIVVQGYEFNGDTPPDPPAATPTYNLTVTTASNGSTTPAYGIHNYPEGTQITATATPSIGYQFIRWTKNTVELIDDNPYTFLVDADITLTPAFQLSPTETPPSTTPGGVKFNNLWEHILYETEKQGIDCTVTLHSLQLQEPDATTKQYTKRYVDSIIKMVIDVQGAEQSTLNAGTHSQVKAKAYCKINVDAGDEVTDSFSNIWHVEAAYAYPVGNLISHYVCDLSLVTSLSFHPAPPYGPKKLKIRVLDQTDMYGYVYLFTFPVVFTSE